MNIAFFSYEYPPDTAGGGIGTYLVQITRKLRNSGHTLTVFTVTKQNVAFWQSDEVYRIPATNWQTFNLELPAYFLALHKCKPFDVAECTDFCACGLIVKQMLPELPIVVKLHTPLYMVDLLHNNQLCLLQKLRFMIGSIIRLRFPRLPSLPSIATYKQEFELLKIAERVSSPSYSIYLEMVALGFSLTNKTDFIPIPFIVPLSIKNIKSRFYIGNDPQIVFIGRLEARKGVVDLAKAIPYVLNAYPNARFTFVGDTAVSPVKGVDMSNYLISKMHKYLNAVTFTGKVMHECISTYLDKGDIFVFPSHFESFGLACCEAMAAGKAVIGSASGGMSEIIQDGISGLVIEPKNPKLLANAIISLISNDLKRISLGNKARVRIDELMGLDHIISLQVECYKKAIDQVATSKK